LLLLQMMRGQAPQIFFPRTSPVRRDWPVVSNGDAAQLVTGDWQSSYDPITGVRGPSVV